jgi:hypothetical protein
MTLTLASTSPWTWIGTWGVPSDFMDASMRTLRRSMRTLAGLLDRVGGVDSDILGALGHLTVGLLRLAWGRGLAKVAGTRKFRT